jgi:hypothetical protein
MSEFFPCVMAGLVPAIHVLSSAWPSDVDARNKSGHDEKGGS